MPCFLVPSWLFPVQEAPQDSWVSIQRAVLFGDGGRRSKRVAHSEWLLL